MHAYIFPGQGAQFPGMGKDLLEKSDLAKELYNKANEILDFSITEIMFEGTAEDLKQTRVTQPAIFLHSVILSKTLGKDFKPDMVAGHSLGEFSALAAIDVLDFESALKLVSQRALSMQEACEIKPSTMAAVIGLPDNVVEDICVQVEGTIVPANYNSPKQVVISGDIKAIANAGKRLKKAGAIAILALPVGGAFHSPLMKPAREGLTKAIEDTIFNNPICPIYQNVTGKAINNAAEIKENLIAQLTSPVLWTQTIQQMIADRATEFTEVGPGKVLRGLMRKINRNVTTNGVS